MAPISLTGDAFQDQARRCPKTAPGDGLNRERGVVFPTIWRQVRLVAEGRWCVFCAQE